MAGGARQFVLRWSGTRRQLLNCLLQRLLMTDGDVQILEWCNQIRQVSFELHRFLKHGHLEKVYELGMVHRLRKIGLSVEQQYRLSVYDEDGAALGDYFADLYVERSIIVELKTCRLIASEHIAQVFGYLRACRRKHALVINFGASVLQVRKVALTTLFMCILCSLFLCILCKYCF